MIKFFFQFLLPGFKNNLIYKLFLFFVFFFSALFSVSCLKSSRFFSYVKWRQIFLNLFRGFGRFFLTKTDREDKTLKGRRDSYRRRQSVSRCPGTGTRWPRPGAGAEAAVPCLPWWWGGLERWRCSGSVAAAAEKREGRESGSKLFSARVLFKPGAPALEQRRAPPAPF